LWCSFTVSVCGCSQGISFRWLCENPCPIIQFMVSSLILMARGIMSRVPQLICRLWLLAGAKLFVECHVPGTSSASLSRSLFVKNLAGMSWRMIAVPQSDVITAAKLWDKSNLDKLAKSIHAYALSVLAGNDDG
jgi:hypothetical protein